MLDPSVTVRWAKSIAEAYASISKNNVIEVKLETKGCLVDKNCVDLICKKFDSIISSMKPSVVVIDISLDNGMLNDETFAILLNYFRSKAPLFHIRRLRAFRNYLSDCGMMTLASFLGEAHPYPIYEIHLSHNLVTDVGAVHLLSSILGAKYPSIGSVSQHENLPPLSFIYPRSNQGMSVPLWCRLERNFIKDPDDVLRKCHATLNVLNTSSTKRFLCCFASQRAPKTVQSGKGCSPSVCVRSKSSTVPIFHVLMLLEQEQGTSTGYKPGPTLVNFDNVEVRSISCKTHLSRGGHPWLSPANANTLVSLLEPVAKISTAALQSVEDKFSTSDPTDHTSPTSPASDPLAMYNAMNSYPSNSSANSNNVISQNVNGSPFVPTSPSFPSFDRPNDNNHFPLYGTPDYLVDCPPVMMGQMDASSMEAMSDLNRLPVMEDVIQRTFVLLNHLSNTYEMNPNDTYSVKKLQNAMYSLLQNTNRRHQAPNQNKWPFFIPVPHTRDTSSFTRMENFLPN